MRILVISYHYPPDRAVGGQRARKIVDSLRAAGHDVLVVAAGAPTDDVPIHRVAPLPSVRDIYAILRRWSASRIGGRRADDCASMSPADATRTVPFWKRWIFSLIWLPDDRQGFILPSVRQGLQLSGGRLDVIYTTAPPFSVHLAGLLLRVLTGACWMAEFRDPWTTNPWKPAYMRSTFSEWLERGLERLCLETADLLIPVSDGIAERLAECGSGTPVKVIRNGIANLQAPATAADLEARGPFEIVYAGSFYYTRDPFPFLASVNRIVAARSLTPENLRVRFIGNIESYNGRSILDHIREMGLDDFVELEGWMDHEGCLHHLQSSDALLLLATDQPDQVPNKLYEYLGTRRPILAVVDDAGETARMLRRVQGHYVVPVNDVRHIRPALDALLERGRQGPVGNPSVLRSWTTAAQMAGLPELIARCVKRGSDN